MFQKGNSVLLLFFVFANDYFTLTTMALTFDSTVKELLNSPEAVEICKKHGMDLTDKRIKIVRGWSARKLAELPGTGMSEEQVKALEEELNAANL